MSLLPLLPVGRPQLLLAGALRQCYSTLIEALSPYSLSPITRYVHTSSKIKPFLLSQTNTSRICLAHLTQEVPRGHHCQMPNKTLRYQLRQQLVLYPEWALNSFLVEP